MSAQRRWRLPAGRAPTNRRSLLLAGLGLLTAVAAAQSGPTIIDVPSRPGVTQQALVEAPEQPRAELLTFYGRRSEGPACEAFAYHGFNGIESEVIAAVAGWMLDR